MSKKEYDPYFSVHTELAKEIQDVTPRSLLRERLVNKVVSKIYSYTHHKNNPIVNILINKVEHLFFLIAYYTLLRKVYPRFTSKNISKLRRDGEERGGG